LSHLSGGSFFRAGINVLPSAKAEFPPKTRYDSAKYLKATAVEM
jgi:hypothetical protein